MSGGVTEGFPTSPAALRMMERVSPTYDNAYVAKWLFEVMGLEWDEARLIFEELKLQAFPETATWGLRYWEERYQIPVDESHPMEERRQAVIIRRSARAPMNPARIEDVIGRLTGRTVRVEENVAPYVFAVHLSDGENAVNVRAVLDRLRRMKPSHQNFWLDTQLPTATVWITETVELPDVGMASDLKEQGSMAVELCGLALVLESTGQPYGLTATLTTDSMWRLEGSVLLDGSRKLNAGIIEEEI